MKRLSIVAMFFVLMSACSSGTDSSSLTIYGTTGNTASASSSISRTSFAKAPSTATLEGSPTSLKIEQYELWVSTSADCSNPVLLSDYGSTPQIFEMAQGAVTMFSATPANGSYNCVIFKMGSVIRFTPDSTAATAFSSCTETEHSFDIFLEGDTFRDIYGNEVAGQGTKTNPVDDAFYLFASTDKSAVPSTTAHEHQKISMSSSLDVPGDTYMIMNSDNLIYEDTDSGTAVCWVDAPVMGFSSTPSVDAIKSWRGCVSGTDTVTTSGTDDGNLFITSSSLAVQYNGSGDVHILNSSDFTNWTEIPGAMNSREAGSSMITMTADYYVASSVSSPIPGIYIQRFDGSSWNDYSNQLTGFRSYNMQFRRDLSYFYVSYAGTSSTGAVRVFRLPLDGSTFDWEAIGLDIATTTSHAYVMDASSSNVFVTDTSSGLSVKRYTNGTGTWATLGDPLTTSAIESHDMLSVGEGMVLIAWTLPSSYSLNLALYTDAVGWQTIGDFTGIRASGVKLDYVGSTIYLLYKDVENASAMTVLVSQTGSSTWTTLTPLTANGPTIYDFDVIGQTPYVLYSHTDSGHTPLMCKKFAIAQ